VHTSGLKLGAIDRRVAVGVAERGLEPLELQGLQFVDCSCSLSDLFFDWLAHQSSTQSLLGVFWIRFLIGVHCCRSRVKGLSLISFSKKLSGNYEEMPLAA